MCQVKTRNSFDFVFGINNNFHHKPGMYVIISYTSFTSCTPCNDHRYRYHVSVLSHCSYIQTHCGYWCLIENKGQLIEKTWQLADYLAIQLHITEECLSVSGPMYLNNYRYHSYMFSFNPKLSSLVSGTMWLRVWLGVGNTCNVLHVTYNFDDV